MPTISLANENINCSDNGYTVIAINGVFTDDAGARKNKDELQKRLPPSYKNQPLKIDYLLNPSHLAGLGDIIDSVAQGAFDRKSDYDLVEMENDASQKITTQKVLLVAHSQGNFYANNLYAKLADKNGGVPKESIGVYGVANPDDNVAGDKSGGKNNYLTSDTDKVIAQAVGRALYILPPNTHIDLKADDDKFGHDFSGVYLKYKGAKIVEDIQNALSKLKNNNTQDESKPCIDPPKLTLAHKLQGVGFLLGDYIALGDKRIIVDAVTTSYKVGIAIENAITNTALALANTAKSLFATAFLSDQTDLNPNLSQNLLAKNDAIQNIGDILPIVTTSKSPPKIDVPVNKEDVASPVKREEIPKVDRNLNSENIAVKNILIKPIDPPTEIRGGGLTNAPPVASPVAPTIITPPILDTTPPVITLNNANLKAITIDSAFTDPGATAFDDVDGAVSVTTNGSVDTSTLGSYTITYTATDSAGNISTATRAVNVAQFVYIPKYSFGLDNGDGNDWQIWAFNGSNIYDWSDTYIDGYLHEQFTLEAYGHNGLPEYYCSNCLERGIFTHNPEEGFNSNDIYTSGLEASIQNYATQTIYYNVVMQWDATGYTYAISHNNTVDFTGHTDIANASAKWVGWDGSQNHFTNFPSGGWYGISSLFPLSRSGGASMVLKPYPVYKAPAVLISPTLSLPTSGIYAGRGINQTRGRSNLTKFNFNIIYTDPSGLAPSDVTLHIKNTTTGAFLSDATMKKVEPGSDALNDGDFTNGEIYDYANEYDVGEYEYYFTSGSLRIPESGGALRFGVIPSTYYYIPKYTFGADNGDGNDWQIWAFNGSNIYDWSNSYIDHYLHQQFKIQAYSGGFYCSSCLLGGVFNHEPQKGFESSDLTLFSLDNNPQNMGNNITYDIDLLWDATGYTYTISHDSTIDSTGHTNVTSIDSNSWVGWTSSSNNFTVFPSGNWYGAFGYFPSGMTGGSDMMLTPLVIYKP